MSSERHVEVDKAAGAALGVSLGASLFMNRISVTVVKPESLAYDLLLLET